MPWRCDRCVVCAECLRKIDVETEIMAPLVNRIRARNNSYVILDIPGFADQRPDSADHGQIHEQQPDYSVGQINLILAIVVPMALGPSINYVTRWEVGVGGDQQNVSNNEQVKSFVTSNPKYENEKGLCLVLSNFKIWDRALVSRRFLWICSLALGLVTLVLMLWPFRVYSDSGPATALLHTEIVSYNYGGAIIERQHGVLVTKHDAYTPDSVLPYPAVYGRTNPFSPPPGVSLRSKSCVGITCTYHISMTGPAHNMLTIWPRQDVNLTSWSLSAAPRPADARGPPVYVLIHNTATYSGQFVPLNVTLNFVIGTPPVSAGRGCVSSRAQATRPQDNTAGSTAW
ncbi:hypothetical protein EVAR_92006_1 [Eumeta japonica]|uniref:Endoplasmic reticulum metallopeptidase 1-like C-terminal domain-containing protein n=1 Tax=Eumeta variegata TaxID=151549 RepID=A0A4C1ZXH3_EUMVA|nr:hypothetical protein EVAR_92006_1 [Eumeta japonica]